MRGPRGEETLMPQVPGGSGPSESPDDEPERHAREPAGWQDDRVCARAHPPALTWSVRKCG
jgi:hypothetical protein